MHENAVNMFGICEDSDLNSYISFIGPLELVQAALFQADTSLEGDPARTKQLSTNLRFPF